jgi:hypothetical protein
MTTTSFYRRRALLIVASSALVLVFILLGIAVWDIQHGVVAGPSLDISISAYLFLISRTDEYPDCHPMSAGCVAASLHPPGTQPQYYTVWIITRQEHLLPSGAYQEVLGGGRVIKWQIKP